MFLCSHISWPMVSGVLLASSALCQGAHQESSQEVVEAEAPPSHKEGWQLLDANTRRRTFYKYERRIRDFSQPDKVFHYFASKTLPDGTRQAFNSVLPEPQSAKEAWRDEGGACKLWTVSQLRYAQPMIPEILSLSCTCRLSGSNHSQLAWIFPPLASCVCIASQ